jgi:hypothetical protein
MRLISKWRAGFKSGYVETMLIHHTATVSASINMSRKGLAFAARCQYQWRRSWDPGQES